MRRRTFSENGASIVEFSVARDSQSHLYTLKGLNGQAFWPKQPKLLRPKQPLNKKRRVSSQEILAGQ